MDFGQKLKKAMQELQLTQTQVVGMTGKSKGSISQYLSGKQVPSEEVQSDIAVSLGLEKDYFSEPKKIVLPKKQKYNSIPKLEVSDAAEMLGMNPVTVRKGLQQGVFPWGYAIHTSDNRWVYFINAKRFLEIEGVTV